MAHAPHFHPLLPYIYKINHKINFSLLKEDFKQNCTKMIEITVNDRLGKKVRIKCNPTDTIGDLKKLVAAQTGTRFPNE